MISYEAVARIRNLIRRRLYLERLTKWDAVRNCYVFKEQIQLTQHVQKLGRYEDKDEIRMIKPTDDGRYICNVCHSEVKANYIFCPYCGQRLKGDLIGAEM